MKKVIFNRFGDIDELQITETEMPSVGAEQILVKVKAISLNPLDWKIRKGEMKLMSGSKFPKNVGIDFSGIVESVGEKVTEWKGGDEVFGAFNGMKGGALAEQSMEALCLCRNVGRLNADVMCLRFVKVKRVSRP